MSIAAIQRELPADLQLFVHIGAGEGEAIDLARASARSILIEPDPDRFSELKVQGHAAPGARLVQAALAEDKGVVAFKRASLGRFGSVRDASGIRTLFRGIQPAGDVEVEAAPLKQFLGDYSQGVSVIVVDAASEALIALEQIEAAGLLRADNQIYVKLAELQLHEGGATRADVEKWANARDCFIERVEGQTDPDIWLARLKPNSKQDEPEATVGEAENEDENAVKKRVKPSVDELLSRIAKLEEYAQSQLKLVQKHRSRAYRLTKQRDQLRDDLEAESETTKAAQEALQSRTSEYEAAARKAHASSEALKNRDDELNRVRAELEEVRAARLSLEVRLVEVSSKVAELSEQSDCLSDVRFQLQRTESERNEIRTELTALKSKINTSEESLADLRSRLKEERDRRQEADAEVSKLNAELEALKRERESERSDSSKQVSNFEKELELVETRLNDLRARLEAERRGRREAAEKASSAEKASLDLRSEIDGLRGDLALALRTQNMAQADLRDLQARYEALTTEKRDIEELLAKLMNRLYDASDRVKALSWVESVGDGTSQSTRRSES